MNGASLERDSLKKLEKPIEAFMGNLIRSTPLCAGFGPAAMVFSMSFLGIRSNKDIQYLWKGFKVPIKNHYDQ